MDDRLRQLRNRVRAHQRGHAATAVRYPAGLRNEIVTVARGADAGADLGDHDGPIRVITMLRSE